MYKNVVIKTAVIIGLFLSFLESTTINPTGTTAPAKKSTHVSLDVPSLDIIPLDTMPVVEAVADKKLYDSWKYVVSRVEKSLTLELEHPTIKKGFTDLYAATQKHRFEKLANTPFDEVFKPKEQPLFFESIENFNTLLRSYVEDHSLMNDEEKQTMFYMLDLNTLFLTRRPASQDTNESMLQRFLRKRWFQAALCIGGITTLLAIGRIALNRRLNQSSHIKPSTGGYPSKPLKVEPIEKPINGQNVTSTGQENLQCGLFAALNCHRMLNEPTNNDLSKYQTEDKELIKTLLEKVKEERIKTFEERWKKFFTQPLSASWETIVNTREMRQIFAALGYKLTYEEIVEDEHPVDTLRNNLPSDIQAPSISDLIHGYTQEIRYINPKFVYAELGEEITEGTYKEWRETIDNRFNFFFEQYAQSNNLVGSRVIDYIKANIDSFKAKQDGFADDDKTKLEELCDNDNLSADEIENIIMPELKKKFNDKDNQEKSGDKDNQILIISDPNQLNIGGAYFARNILINSKDNINKINLYRTNKTPIGIILNVNRNHWIAVLMTYDEKGHPLAKVADSMGGDYINNKPYNKDNRKILRKVMEMFTEDDLSMFYIVNSFDGKMSSAENPNSRYPLPNLCKAIIDALYGYRGRNGVAKSYFGQDNFKQHLSRLQACYARIKGLHTQGKLPQPNPTLSPTTLYFSKTSHINKEKELILNDFNYDQEDLTQLVTIPIDLNACDTFDKLVAFLRDNGKLKALLENDPEWHTK